jgi:hypothetical protein
VFENIGPHQSFDRGAFLSVDPGARQRGFELRVVTCCGVGVAVGVPPSSSSAACGKEQGEGGECANAAGLCI